MKKRDLQERYRSVLAAADRNPDAVAQHDWSGMDALMDLIFDAFKHAYEHPSGDAIAREGECR
jgi:hypothetical protein